jgi:L-arabinose isomerase
VKLETLYRKSVQGKDSAMPGQTLVIVDTAESQDWIEDVLYRLKPEDAWGMSIHAGSFADHEEYIAQLLNDAPVDRVDTRGNAQITWDRIDESVPNDWRDCERYAFVAAMMLAPRAEFPSRSSVELEPKRKAVLMGGGGRRPDGRGWI